MAGETPQEPSQTPHVIPSYCEYINKYILQSGVHGIGAVPGAHPFVALYLVPRLAASDPAEAASSVTPERLAAGVSAAFRAAVRAAERREPSVTRETMLATHTR